MTQVFGRKADLLLRGGLIALAVGVSAVAAAAAYRVVGSPSPQRERALIQPVPFSHQHHVGGLGIECGYCHTSVERSPSAGLPETTTCMSCHSQIWTNASMLEPVRASLRDGTPIRWRRVHDLADYVYFDHSVHVANGVGCESCHGRVDRMPLTRRSAPLTMSWCLDCHREPEPHLRPADAIFAMGWQPPANIDRDAYGARLARRYGIDRRVLTNCSTCHR